MANKIQYQVGFDVKQQDLNKLKSSLKQLQNLKISDIMKINGMDTQAATSALTNIKKQAMNVQSALKQAFNTKLNTVNIETFNQTLLQSGSSIQQVYDAFRRAGTNGENTFRSLSSQVLSTNIQLKEAHGLLDKMATTLSNTVKWNAASTAVNGLTRSVQQAWGYVKSLDTSLNNIRIVTGKSAQEMGNFAIQANNAAKELGKTTTDYTNAALIYAQQGLDDKEIAERTAITLKTANVTGQSAADVSEELTAVWNGYKVNAEQAELYVDRLAAVAATTASDLEELSTGMSKVASAAAAMGVGEDQLAAQLSTIISVTRQAPESVGTALRTVYARISDIKAGIDEDGVTLGNYSGKMADLGFNVLDATGHLRDMGEVMEEIGGRWQDLTREQQVNLAQTMAGQRQYNNLLALFDNFEEYNKALATAQNAAGTLQEQQDIYMESTAAHLQQLKAATEDVYDSLVDADSINPLIDTLTSVVNLTADFIDGIGGGGAVIRSLGAIATTVFSDQIARGLNTTIANFEIAKENARQFDQALQATKKWQGIEGLNQDSAKLLNIREQLLQLAKVMTPEQFSGMQTLLNDIIELGSEIEAMEAKIEPLQDILKNFTKLSLKDVLGTKEADIIIEKINAPIGSLDDLKIKIKEVKEEFRTSFADAKNLFDVSGVNTFAEIFDSIRPKMVALLDTFHDIRATDAFQGMSDKAKKEFDKIQNEWDQVLASFDKASTPQGAEYAAQKLKSFFDELSTVASTSSKEMKTVYEELLKTLGDPSLFNNIEQQQAKLDQMIDRFVTGQERMKRAADIKSYAQMAGGIAQVGSAIQQIQNLGSVWKNQDLSIGQKLLQIITNLAFSLPMLTNGFIKATTAIGIAKVAMGEESAAAAFATIQNAGHAASLGAVGIAAGKGTIAIKILNATLLLNPFAAFALGVAGAVTALGLFIKRAEEANETIIKNSQATIEEENTKQQEIEKNRELINSLHDLDQQYKNGEISRSDVKSAVQDLIDQYGLEQSEVDKLTQSYGNLSNYIDETRGKMAQQAFKSASRERDAAVDEVESTAKGKFFDEGKEANGRYQLKIGAGISGLDESSEITNLLKQAGASTSNGADYNFDVNFDSQSIEVLYDNIQKVISGIEDLKQAGKITKEQLDDSELYANLVKWSDKMSDSIERYKAAKKEVDKYNVQLEAFTAQDAGIVDLSSDSIKTGNDYLRERAALIQEIEQRLGKSRDDAAAMTDVYLQENFKNIYNQFNEVAKYIESLRDKFGTTNKEVQDIISKLNPQQLGFIEDFQLKDISNWEDLKNIIDYIASTDFSNLQVITDPQAAIDSATEQYDLYSSLADQIAGSKKQTVSKKEYQKFDPEIQSFFTLMANGTYKMTGDAKEFYDTVNNLSIEGFKKNIADLEGSIKRLENLQGADFNKLSQSAASQNQNGSFSFNRGDVQNQLDYLTETGYDLEKIIQWKAELSDDNIMVSTLNDIAAAVGETGDQIGKFSTYLQANKDAIYQNQLAIAGSASTFKDLQNLLDQGVISEKAFTQAAIELDKSLDTQNLDIDEWDNYSDHLQQIAKQSNELSDELETNEEAADIVAKGIMKMNDAVDTLADNWENWSDIIQNSTETSEEYTTAMGEARGTVADLLDISKDFVSEDFIKNHLSEITQAAKGSETAIDGLKSALAEDLIVRITVENGIDESMQAQILSSVADLQAMIPDIEVGATLETGDFINKAQKLIEDCGMTVTQANAMFDALGFEANFATEEQKVTQRVPKTVTKTEVTGYTPYQADMINPDGTVQTVSGQWPILSQWTYNDGFAEQEGTIEVPAMATNGKTPVINSLTRKATGSSNNYSSSNVGGPSPGKSSNKGNKSKGNKGNKGKSKKADEPDKSTKELKKTLEDERDIYHDINIEIEKINRNLDRVQKQQDRLYGKELLNNLEKQSKLLEQHKNKLQEKHDLQQQDLKDQRQTLKNLGVTFNAYGDISNYMDVLERKQKDVNDLIKLQNELIKQYNKQTDKDSKKKIADSITTQEQRVKAAEDKYKELQDKIKDYDSLRNDMEDVIDQIEDETQKEIQINIKKFRMEVEIRLDLGEAERDWNQFRREVLEHTDVLKDTNFQKIFSDATQSYRDATSYFNINGSRGSLETLTEQLNSTRNQIEAIDNLGGSAIYGDNKAQAMEDLQNDLQELMGQLEDIQGLIDNIDEAYLDTIDDIQDQFDKQIEDYEYVGELIEHDIDLLQLLYGDKNYNTMDKYYSTLQSNNLRQLDSLRKQREFWKAQWQDAVDREDTQAAKQFEQNYRNTIQNLNQLIEESARNIRDKYINAIDKIFDELDKKISNGKGTDYLSMQWDLMNKNANEYLDTINSAFAIQETERKYQQALDETKSIKNQQTLKTLMDEQLSILKNKEKITQYDVDRANKLLQVEQARMALQNAQSSKTSMRLKRDSQGNYSYEYAADNNAIDEAQNNLAQVQNDLYNFDKDRYESNLNDMLAAWKDFQSDYKDIIEDVSLTEQQRIEKLALLRQQYGEYINDKTAENLTIRNNLMESAFADLASLYNTDVENYNQMSIDEQNILMQDLVPAWKSGIQEMALQVAGEGGFIPTCEEAFDNVTEATKKYEEELDQMAEIAGIDLLDVRRGIDDVADSFAELIIKNDELNNKATQEIKTITSLKDAAHQLTVEYESVYSSAIRAVSGINSFLQAQKQKAAAEAEAAKPKTTASSKTASTSTSSSNNKNKSKSTTSSHDANVSRSQNQDDQEKATEELVEGIAGNIWIYGTWGDNPDRKNNMIKKFGKTQGTKIYNAVQAKFNSGYGYTKDVEHDWDYYKKYALSKFDTGGYTGTWAGNDGKLAVLHQKELVLNKDDTQNILDSVNIMRAVVSNLNGNIATRLGDIRTGYAQIMEGREDSIEQNVHIEANFPNVNSKKEIEDAFNDLVNLAAQRVMRRR